MVYATCLLVYVLDRTNNQTRWSAYSQGEKSPTSSEHWPPVYNVNESIEKDYISDVVTEKGRDKPRDIPVVGPRHAKHARLPDGHNLNSADLTRLNPIQRIRTWTIKRMNEWQKTNGSHWHFSSFLVLTCFILWCSMLAKKHVILFWDKAWMFDHVPRVYILWWYPFNEK